MSFVTQHTTKSINFNLLGNIVEEWNENFPENQVTAVASHASPEGVFGFAYCADALTVELLELEADLYGQEPDESESPFSEYEQGWRNIREDERAAVARQVKEDQEFARRQANVPYCLGVRGSFEPDGGVIFEP